MADFYDIDATFSLNAVGDLNILTDVSAIEQSFKTILFSSEGFRPGEGVANNLFGVSLDSYLFNELTLFTGQQISDDIYRQIVTYEPRIEIDNIDVNVNVDELRYEIEITYKLNGSSEDLTFRTIINQI